MYMYVCTTIYIYIYIYMYVNTTYNYIYKYHFSVWVFQNITRWFVHSYKNFQKYVAEWVLASCKIFAIFRECCSTKLPFYFLLFK